MKPRIVRGFLGDNPPTARLYYGIDNRESLRALPEASVHMACCSPPYWALRKYETEPLVWGGDPNHVHIWEEHERHRSTGGDRDYGSYDGAVGRGPGVAVIEHATCPCGAWRGHLGLEPTPEMYVEHLVEIFNEVARVLRPDGTLWVNIGDSFSSGGRQGHGTRVGYKQQTNRGMNGDNDPVRIAPPEHIKPKDLVGIPWMLAFAMRDAGWYLRSDIIWAKGNPMPESVRDRPTRAHEYVFLFAHPESRGRYFYDSHAVRERESSSTAPRRQRADKRAKAGWSEAHFGNPPGGLQGAEATGSRNKRSVWTVNPVPYKGAHFAVWPPKLVKPMVRAGTSEKGACPSCGAPWHRVLGEAVRVEGRGSGAKERKTRRQEGHGRVTDGTSDLGSTIPWQPTVTPTAGWEPGCDCPEHEPVRCVVLDPFSGSGTTGKVALAEGRDYIGLDLSESYEELTEPRILGLRPPVELEGDGGVFDLFGGEE